MQERMQKTEQKLNEKIETRDNFTQTQNEKECMIHLNIPANLKRILVRLLRTLNDQSIRFLQLLAEIQ
jgi:hypothetical protein